jgi:hypothetical protein
MTAMTDANKLAEHDPHVSFVLGQIRAAFRT